MLKEVEGLSLNELEQVYGVRANALKVRLFRARKRALQAFERIEMKAPGRRTPHRSAPRLPCRPLLPQPALAVELGGCIFPSRARSTSPSILPSRSCLAGIASNGRSHARPGLSVICDGDPGSLRSTRGYYPRPPRGSGAVRHPGDSNSGRCGKIVRDVSHASRDRAAARGASEDF